MGIVLVHRMGNVEMEQHVLTIPVLVIITVVCLVVIIMMVNTHIQIVCRLVIWRVINFVRRRPFLMVK